MGAILICKFGSLDLVLWLRPQNISRFPKKLVFQILGILISSFLLWEWLEVIGSKTNKQKANCQRLKFTLVEKKRKGKERKKERKEERKIERKEKSVQLCWMGIKLFHLGWTNKELENLVFLLITLKTV